MKVVWTDVQNLYKNGPTADCCVVFFSRAR